jgi:hypothetical protein
MGGPGDCLESTHCKVRKRDGFRHAALDIGGFAVALDANHPARRKLIIAADLTTAENPAGISGNGGDGNTSQLRYSRRHTEIGDREGLASPAQPTLPPM